MNKFISDLRTLTASELLIVLFTPLSGIALSAAFFFRVRCLRLVGRDDRLAESPKSREEV